MIDVHQFAAATGIRAPLERVRMQEIVEQVADLANVPVAAIMSKYRGDMAIARARQFAMWQVRRQLGFSYPRIGRFFRRDHTTVLYACRMVEARLASEPRTPPKGATASRG